MLDNGSVETTKTFGGGSTDTATSAFELVKVTPCGALTSAPSRNAPGSWSSYGSSKRLSPEWSSTARLPTGRPSLLIVRFENRRALDSLSISIRNEKLEWARTASGASNAVSAIRLVSGGGGTAVKTCTPCSRKDAA